MPYLTALTISAWDLIGLIGAAVYIGAYILAALDMLPSQGWQFYAFNLVAGGLVLAGLVGGDFNLASAVIQLFYAGVSVLGLALHRGHSQRRSDLPRRIARLGAARS
ncbi:MAG: hypothetical protein R3D59_05995 [Paracoccaceae bacterium]